MPRCKSRAFAERARVAQRASRLTNFSHAMRWRPAVAPAAVDGRAAPLEIRVEESGSRHQLETPMTFTSDKFTSITFKALGGAGIAIAMYAIPALAHHSFAMFDASQKTTVAGTVKEFQWTNPHAWITLMVANSDGQLDQWSIEMGGPSGLARQGWIPKTLTPGMSVSVVIHPLRDGAHGGQFLAVTLPDGTQMGNPDRNPTQAE
jgi:hypothetical protein